jgi:serine/threonine protein kinase
MGQVFRAQSPTGEEVAVKLLTTTLTPEARARFDRERALLSAIPAEAGFVTLLDAGETPHGPFLVMPLFRGGSLRDRFLRSGELGVVDAIDLGRQIAAALAEAHRREIVHRDLKPSNVLLDDRGRAWIADLGLAKVLHGGGGDSLSQTGSIRGSVGYMPPEQMRDAKRAGTEADVFAWGAILYEALAGGPPFGDGPPLESISNIEAGRFGPLTDERPEVPAGLAQLIHRCLSSDPEQRPRNGRELLTALEDAILLSPPPPRKGVSLGIVLALGVVILGLGIGLGLGLASPTDPSPAPSPSATLAPEPGAGASATPSLATPSPVAETPSPVAETPSPVAETPSPALRPSPEPEEDEPGSQPASAFVHRGMLGSYNGRHMTLVTDVAWDASGETLASVGLDGFLRLWNPETGERAQSYNFSRSLHTVDLHPSGKWAVLGGDMGAALMTLRPTPKAEPFEAQGSCLAATMVGEGEAVAAAVGKDLYLFEVPSRRVLWRQADAHEGEGKNVNAIRYSPARDEIVTGQRGVKVWSRQGKLLRSYPPLTPKYVIEDLAITPQGDKIYVTTRDPDLFVLEREGPGPPGRLGSKRFKAAPSQARSLAPTPDGGVLSGHSNGILLYRGPQGEGPIGKHFNWIHGLRLGPGHRVATASNDGTLAVYSLAKGKAVWEASGHRGAGAQGLLSVGSRAYSVGTDGVRVWDLESGRETRHLPSQSSRLGSVSRSLTLSPSQGLLVRRGSAGLAITELEGGTTSFWEAPQGTQVDGASFASESEVHVSLASGRVISLRLGKRDQEPKDPRTPPPPSAGQPGRLALRYLPEERAFLTVYPDRIERSGEQGAASLVLKLPFQATKAAFDSRGVLWVAGGNRLLGVAYLGPEQAPWSVDFSAQVSQIQSSPCLGPRRQFAAFVLAGRKVGIYDCSQPERIRQVGILDFGDLGNFSTSLGWTEGGELLVGTRLGPIYRYRRR